MKAGFNQTNRHRDKILSETPEIVGLANISGTPPGEENLSFKLLNTKHSMPTMSASGYAGLDEK